MATSWPKHGERYFRVLVGSSISVALLGGGCGQETYLEERWDSSTEPRRSSPRVVIESETVDVGEVHSPCLDAAEVIFVPDVPDGTRKSIRAQNNAAYDMRGVGVLAEPTTHLVDFEDPANICVTGVSVVAKYPVGFAVNWENMKYGDGTYGPYDEGGLHTSYPQSGTTIFDRVYIEGVEDGLMIARRTAYNPAQRWELRDSYLKNVVDDAVENDGFRSGKIIDVLSEGTHMFYSARNNVQLAHTLLIDHSVIGFGCKPDDRTDSYRGAGACPKGTSTQRVFKLGSLVPNITMQNTVIHHPAVSREGPEHTCLPSKGTYRDVVIVWTASVRYPCPALTGVTVTTDESVYANARADWLLRHRCQIDGTGCAFLSR